MVTVAELNDDSEYEEIKEDVTAECSEHGAVLSVIIPRTKEGYSYASEGLIFVEFIEPYAARNCAMALSGRKFAERFVDVEYVSVNII
jgi:RNA recognition motif-containing protein